MATSKPKTVRPGARSKLAAAAKKSKLGRKPPPPNESRRERFERIGAKRMANVIRQIQLLGNLCGANYECSGDDLILMRDSIHNELEMALARFSPKKRQAASNGFSFAPTLHTQHDANRV